MYFPHKHDSFIIYLSFYNIYYKNTWILNSIINAQTVNQILEKTTSQNYI